MSFYEKKHLSFNATDLNSFQCDGLSVMSKCGLSMLKVVRVSQQIRRPKADGTDRQASKLRVTTLAFCG